MSLTFYGYTREEKKVYFTEHRILNSVNSDKMYRYFTKKKIKFVSIELSVRVSLVKTIV